MQDRRGEAGRLGEVGVRVERVPVTAQPVEQRLLGSGRVGRLGVRRPVRQLDRLGAAAVAAPAALAAHEDRGAGGPQLLTGLGGRDPLLPDHRGLALVPDVGERRADGRGAGCRHRRVHGDRLRSVHDLGQVDVAARQVQRRRVGLVERRHHHPERRQHLQARAVGGPAERVRARRCRPAGSRRRWPGGRAGRRSRSTRTTPRPTGAPIATSGSIGIRPSPGFRGFETVAAQPPQPPEPARCPRRPGSRTRGRGRWWRRGRRRCGPSPRRRRCRRRTARR